MNGLVLGYFLIVLVRILNRAIFDADGATCALIFNYVPGFFDQGHVEIAGFAFDRLDFRVCEHFNVWVPADLDQLGCEYSHRTVVGGERLVQLGHDPTDGW